MPESKAKESILSIVEDLEKELEEERNKYNRAIAENQRLKNAVKSIVDLFEKGDQLCRMLKL